MQNEELRRRFESVGGGRDGAAGAFGVTIHEGSLRDYWALARFHYIAGRPGPVARVLRAADERSGELAGVLVASMPTLNGRWRALAWPGRYAGADAAAGVRRLNAEVRTISRVVVDPRYRGRGVAVALVGAYLANPCTVRTEAVAAMARACPFFERAGMRRVHAPSPPADGALRRRLAPLGGPAALLEPAPAEAARDALHAWARRRRLRNPDGRALAARAYAALTHPPLAFVHDRSLS